MRTLRAFANSICAIALATGSSAALDSTQDIGRAKQAAIGLVAIRKAQTDKQPQQLRSGTAFLVRYSDAASKSYKEFIVTARHLLEGADEVNVLINRNLSDKDIKAGLKKVISVPVPLNFNNSPQWKIAADDVDLAVIYWKSFTEDDVRISEQEAREYVEEKSTATTSWLANLVLTVNSEGSTLEDSELADLFVTGFPLLNENANWLRPITRRCTLANSHVGDLPIEDPNPHYFLIDCPSFPGDSGAPVFRKIFNMANFQYEIGSELVGILVSSVYTQRVIETETMTITLREPMHLTRVVPIKYVLKTIESFLESGKPQKSRPQ